MQNQNWVLVKSVNWTLCDPPEDIKFMQRQNADKLVAALNILIVFDSGDDSKIVMRQKKQKVSLTANHQCVMSSKCLGTCPSFPGTFLSCSEMVAFQLSS